MKTAPYLFMFNYFLLYNGVNVRKAYEINMIVSLFCTAFLSIIVIYVEPYFFVEIYPLLLILAISLPIL